MKNNKVKIEFIHPISGFKREDEVNKELKETILNLWKNNIEVIYSDIIKNSVFLTFLDSEEAEIFLEIIGNNRSEDENSIFQKLLSEDWIYSCDVNDNIENIKFSITIQFPKEDLQEVEKLLAEAIDL